MSKPWGGVGAWALEAERADAEELERATTDSSTGRPTVLSSDLAQNFPSLKEASTKPKKKKKGVSVSLAEFTTGAYDGPGGSRRQSAFEPKGLTTDEMQRLPAGPRDRTAEELEHSRMGGGFRSYGYGSGGAAPPRRRSDFGMDDEQRRGPPPPRSSDLDQPSRADDVDNWAAGKKPFAPTMDTGRQDRYSSLWSGSSSKADDVDNWSLGKKSIAPPPSRYSGFGSGVRDSPNSGLDSGRWARGGGEGSLSSNGERERQRLVLDQPRRDSGSQPEPVRSRPSPFGAARPREEVLAEKGLDWKKIETEIEIKKTGGPKSSQSSRPSSAQSSRPGSPASQVSVEGATPKPRPKVNPFGDAKPREVLLEEKGMDWKKIDQELEHRRVDRTETDEEMTLKEEIDHLKKELGKETEGSVNGDSPQNSTEQLDILHEQIIKKEKELGQLIRELDDKIRFRQRASSDARSGSGASEDSRHYDRPRSRGMGDSWGRPMDERRGVQSSRDSGFLSSRSMDRPNSRERW